MSDCSSTTEARGSSATLLTSGRSRRTFGPPVAGWFEASIYLLQAWAVGILLILNVINGRGGILSGRLCDGLGDIFLLFELGGLVPASLLLARGKGRPRLSGAVKCAWDLGWTIYLVVAWGTADVLGVLAQLGRGLRLDIYTVISNALLIPFYLHTIATLNWRPTNSIGLMAVAALSIGILWRLVRSERAQRPHPRG